MKFNIFKIAILTSALFLLTACASSHQCKLGDSCFGLDDAYEASLADAGSKETVLPEYSAAGKADSLNKNKQSNSEQLVLQGFSAYSGSKLTAKPVYQPPRPIRIWIAPWQANLDSYTQTAPVLMGDQFLYATIPGHWQMGELRGQGELNRMMLEPLIPNNEDKEINRVQPKQVLFE